MSDTTKFGPPKGMRDGLPKEVQLRQKLIRLIESQYQLYSFQPIDTPVMENIEVLQGKGGGENEKLMFKILKRGEELKNAFEEAMKEHGGSESGYLSSSTPEQTFETSPINRSGTPPKTETVRDLTAVSVTHRRRWRKPSLSRLKANTVHVIASPGAIHSHGAMRNVPCSSRSIMPHSGMSG